MRLVCVPSTLALLPEYASVEDPVAELRRVVQAAVAWLLEEGSAQVVAATPSAQRIGEHLLGGDADGPGRLVVANGSARRTEKAPGHFDERAAAFDAAIGKALTEGDTEAFAGLDLDLAAELWVPDAPALARLAEVGPVAAATVDYDDDPYGVQYWVVRWRCGS